MAVGGIVKGIKTAAKAADDTPILDELVSSVAGFKAPPVKAQDEIIGEAIEEIDIGATPLPGGQQALYDDILGAAIEEETQHKLKSFEDILFEEVEKTVEPELSQEAVDQLSVLSAVGKTSGFEVDQVLAESLGHDFKPQLKDVKPYLEETYPNLPAYAQDEVVDLYGSGLITGDEISKVASKKAANPGKIWDQIAEDIKSYPHTPDADMSVEEIDELTDQVFNGHMSIGDAKTLIESKVLSADKADFEEGALDWISMTFDDDEGLGFKQENLDIIGGEWAANLFKLHEEEIIDHGTTQEFLKAALKIQKGESLNDAEASVFDIVTDFFDTGVDAVVASGKKEPTFLDMDRPNSPATMEKLAKDYETGPIREWIDMLSPEETQALQAMAYVRGGGGFLEVAQNVRRSVRAPQNEFAYPGVDVVDTMDDMDIAAINFYSMRGDKIMNPALRAGRDLTGTDLGEAINATVRALDNLPSWDLEDAPVLYRRVNDNHVRQLFESMPIGQEYSEKAFMSTTHKKVIADPEDPTTATDSLVFVVRPKEGGNGKAMEGLSEFQHENEVLFKPGSRFRLVRRETVPESEGWKRTVVFIEEL